MALTVVSKERSVNSNTPSANTVRPQVSVRPPSGSTARAEALKARLKAAPPTQPVTPRPTGSSARREEMAKLNKFTAAPVAQQLGKTSARNTEVNLGEIAPPPSGITRPVQETNSVEATPTPEVTRELDNPQLAILLQKEQQIRKAQQKLKMDREAWEQERAGYLPKATLQTDTLKALAEAGITPDKLVELQLNQATEQDPQQILINKIAALEAKLSDLTDPEKGQFAQRDLAAYNQAVAQIRSDATLMVDSNPSFGTIKSEGQTEEVVSLITKVFETEGVVLDVEEAAQLVEDKLADRLYKQYERISKYDKIMAKLGKVTESPEVSPAKQTPQSKGINTLTNAGAVTRPLSPRDRAVLRVQSALDANKR